MSKKLLLADDSITIQKVVQITFAHEDYELSIADNGDSAFEKARELKPDLVMADVYMPGKNGYELCTALKQDPDCRNIPVLLLAGSFEPFDEDKARAAQADAWLVKPFESQVLIDKVAELLAVAPDAEAEDAERAPESEADAAEEAIAEPASADSTDDPFGTISFDEELFSEEEPEGLESDDWSDLGEMVESHEVSAVSGTEESDASPASQPETAATDDFAVADQADSEAAVEGDDEELIAASSPVDEEMFTFEEETEDEPLGATEKGSAEFDEDDGDDIMPLDDDDILGFEDLEPLEEEQTLVAWSRDKIVVSEEDEELAPFDDVSEADAADAEPVAEPVGSPGSLDEPTPFLAAPEDDAPAEVEPVASFMESSEDIDSIAGFESDMGPATAGGIEPEADLDSAPQPLAAENEDEAAVESEVEAVSGSEIEARAAALDEAEIEAIVEKVAGRVIERLAGTILEKIAWEVVPDLAEALIKEEISKIRDSAA